ncbi:hypothetical protein EV174_002242 [Coemansia sp. RSA 2320]|nr:hypothetical protein EV174_002242 [Coemansia sp. RSA 2320]
MSYRCHGRLRNKLIFAGVTLWLASTVIAGVRRSTGWTHNSHRLATAPPPAPPSAPSAPLLHPPGHERMLWLEQQYIASAPDDATREQRRAWVAAEQERVARAWGCRSHGGFMSWYLGIGERTLDWAARKISRSPNFHWQPPTADGAGAPAAYIADAAKPE